MQPVEYEERWYIASTTGIAFLDEDGEMMDYLPRPQSIFTSKVEWLANMPYHLFPNRLRRFFPKIESLKPFFAWVSNDKIKQCLDKTTQHYRGVVHYPFRKHFKSRFPAANVPRLNEWQATDTFFEYKEGWYDARTTGIVFLDEDREMMDYLLCLLSNMLYHLFPNRLHRFFPKIESLMPFFTWVSNDKIKQCLDKTTQHYHGVVHYPFRKHFKLRFSAANVPRLNKWQATDTVFLSRVWVMRLLSQEV
eukprot:scaffold4428_cov228-Amphora_coffeaeformis.AAC.3